MVVTNSDLNREIGEIKQLVIDLKENNKKDHKSISDHLARLNGKVESNTKKLVLHSFIFKFTGACLSSGLFLYLFTYYIIPSIRGN